MTGILEELTLDRGHRHQRSPWSRPHHWIGYRDSVVDRLGVDTRQALDDLAIRIRFVVSMTSVSSSQ